jgi:hypothetical protein
MQNLLNVELILSLGCTVFDRPEGTIQTVYFLFGRVNNKLLEMMYVINNLVCTWNLLSHARLSG